MIFKRKTKVFALVGRSGTGKSFRAQYVASKHHIKYIVDDGLLIKGNRILAGKSAKQELNFVSAVRCALFQNPSHRNEIIKAISQESISKILIIGTSDKMIDKICETLNLPQVSNWIHIEDIASKDEIETAMRVRYTEGKHVIPVPPLQITRSYPSIVYDSIRVGLKNKLCFWGRQDTSVSEKTLVKPQFSRLDDNISLNVIKQMIGQCLYEYENTMKIQELTYKNDNEGYLINLVLRTPVQMTGNQILELEEYISDSLEKYGGILINKVNLSVQVWS